MGPASRLFEICLRTMTDDDNDGKSKIKVPIERKNFSLTREEIEIFYIA
jgi:hypothetical protein